MVGDQALDQLGVERLGEAGVGHRGVEAVLGSPAGPRRRSASGHAVAVAEQRHALALAQHLAAADLDRARARRAAARPRPRRAGSAAPPGRRRTASAVCSMSPSRASSRGAISDDVRQAAQVGDVEGAVVGRAVVADEAGAVHREHHVQVLEADVVDDLVVGRAGGRSSRSRPPASRPGAPARRRTGPRAARRCRRRSSGRAAPSGGCSGPVPEFIAAVMPSTRSSRRHSATSASPKTVVYCGGGGLARGLRRKRLPGAAAPLTIEAGLAACHFSMPSSPPSSAGAKPLPLTVLQCTTTGRSASSASPIASRSAFTSWPSITPT